MTDTSTIPGSYKDIDFFRRSMGFSSWDNIAEEGVKVFELIGGGVQ